MKSVKSLLLLFSAATVAVALAGCGTTGGTSTGDPGSGLDQVVNFTKADLEAAESNAVNICNANPQASACIVVPCPPAIEKWIDSTVGGVGSLQVKGLFSGAVAGQAVVNGVQAGVPDYVFTACGPAYMKFHADIYNLLGKAALIGG